MIYRQKLDSFAYISAAESIGIYLNHFYVIRQESYRIWWNYAAVRSSKVTEFGTNRKLICDFLLVINTNYLAQFPRYIVQ